jgi:hypothetical protein
VGSTAAVRACLRGTGPQLDYGVGTLLGCVPAASRP